jgi:hypothetical protein
MTNDLRHMERVVRLMGIIDDGFSSEEEAVGRDQSFFVFLRVFESLWLARRNKYHYDAKTRRNTKNLVEKTRLDSRAIRSRKVIAAFPAHELNSGRPFRKGSDSPGCS